MQSANSRFGVAALVFGILTVLAASQPTEEELAAVKESMRQVTLRNPMYQAVPTERGCQSNTMEFILGCLDMLPLLGNDLGVAINKVAKIDGENIVLNGQIMLEVMATNPPMSKSCCVPLCELAKAGCACKEDVYDSMIALSGGDKAVTSEVLNKAATMCKATHPEMSFVTTIWGTPQCVDSFEATANTFMCT